MLQLVILHQQPLKMPRRLIDLISVTQGDPLRYQLLPLIVKETW